MIWNNYSQLKDTHAFLSPSKYHWLRYDDEKLIDKYVNHRAAALGTRIHAYAAESIALGQRLPDIQIALNMFVNDAIGFGMSPEVVLFYSQNCFGTADAISFFDGILRIHDLKTGVSPASMDQLMVYTGIFCLDYELEAKELREVHLRIYQGDQVIIWDPDLREVAKITKRIVEADRVLKKFKETGIF